MSLYNADGQQQVTIVSGATYTGLYTIDGQFNGVLAPAPTIPIGSQHPCGALWVTLTTNPSAGAYAPDGSRYIIASSNGFALATGSGRSTFPGSSVDLNFATGNYYGSSALTTVRASSGYANDASGNWTLFGNNIPRITNLGLLVEESRINAIRNNSMQGAIVGTPGTLPTNWGIQAANGLATNVIGFGTESGIDYLDVQIVGATSGTTYQLRIGEGPSQIAAVQNQVWGQSVFLRQVGGDYTNITQSILASFEFTAGVVFLQSDQVNISNPTSAALSTQRFTNIFTVGQATAAFLMPVLQLNTNNGAAVNITLRIGWPQLELGAFVTSPIRTTAAAVTRAADVITLTSPPVFGAAYSMFVKGTPQTSGAVAIAQNPLSISDNSNNNRFVARRNGTPFGEHLVLVTGGAVNINADMSTAVWGNVSGKIAFAGAAGDQKAAFNGTLDTNSYASAMPVGVNTVYIGASATGDTWWNGFIERIALWPTTRITNTQLQQITT